MAKYLQEELTRKGFEKYIPQMEEVIAEREGVHMMKCFECFYSMFGKCPVNGSRNNAACLQLQKSYFDMSRKELEEITEEEYKKALHNAAQMYHVRMDYIANIFEGREEHTDEEISIH